MTDELLNEIDGLALRFSSGSRKENSKDLHDARQMILYALEGVNSEQGQTELMGRLRASEGKSLSDLDELIHGYLVEKTSETKTTRHAIGKLNLKRKTIDKSKR